MVFIKIFTLLKILRNEDKTNYTTHIIVYIVSIYISVIYTNTHTCIYIVCTHIKLN